MDTKGTDEKGRFKQNIILVVLGVMFYWAAYKVYVTPKTQMKKKQNLIERLSDPSYKKSKKK